MTTPENPTPPTRPTSTRRRGTAEVLGRIDEIERLRNEQLRLLRELRRAHIIAWAAGVDAAEVQTSGYDPAKDRRWKDHAWRCSVSDRRRGLGTNFVVLTDGRRVDFELIEEDQMSKEVVEFIDGVRAHGRADASFGKCHRLIVLAGRHHRACELECNGAPRPEAEVLGLEAAIRKLAAEVGATGVVFQGDPRGSTVKLTFADGAANDLGRTGWCVPAGFRSDD